MPSNPHHPIGVFDSGIGGLSILKAIRAHLPCENLIYVADSAYLPYGEKTATFIQERSLDITKILLAHPVKAIVVACNTATAAAIKTLRGHFTLPIVGVEPAVKPAMCMTKSGVVGVLATNSTLSSDKFANLVDRFGRTADIIVQPCPGLVEQVEKGELLTDTTRDMLQAYLEPLIAEGADTIVLGCTHYPFLSPLITVLVGPNVQIVDTGKAVAVELMRRLHATQLLATHSNPGWEQFWTSGVASDVGDQIRLLWGGNVAVSTFSKTLAPKKVS